LVRTQNCPNYSEYCSTYVAIFTEKDWQQLPISPAYSLQPHQSYSPLFLSTFIYWAVNRY
jgi:hypothetical protein